MSTPVQRQYWELKKKNPDAILFFRLGDFYEMFFEDAHIASRILGIALTARHRGTENEMPMCGFPFHAHEEYLEKLIDSGYKVAIAEQKECQETKKIIREVIRIVTPGATMQEGNLQPDSNTFLASIGIEKSQFALAYSDLSTGVFRTALFEHEIAFFDELYKLNPSEILLEQTLFEDESFCKKLPSTHLTPQSSVSSKKYEDILKNHFGVPNLDIFDIGKISLLIQVSGLLLKYLQNTQKSDLSHLSKLIRYSSSETMGLDRQTFQHLEIFESLFGEKESTLWSVFEKSCTPLGQRMLRTWVSEPMVNEKKIQKRQNLVQELITNVSTAQLLEKYFREIADLERILSRFVTGRGTPRDAGFLRNSLLVFPDVSKACANSQHPFIQSQSKLFESFTSLSQKLKNALVKTPPIVLSEGNIFTKGFSSKLDDLREISQNAQKWLDDFLKQQKSVSGISTLRVKYSKNFGFCLEVSHGQKNKVPSSWIRRQTLVNAERFTTPELTKYETKVLSAKSESFALEQELFHQLRQEILTYQGEIQEIAQSIGTLDALLSLARTAIRWRWTKPAIVHQSTELLIQEGRHPVVEKNSVERFISNNLEMDESSRFHLITGPNMAGKSTFLRQNALIVFFGTNRKFCPGEACKNGDL
jgi:DNA mismatch repair protein MutS